MHLFNHLIKFFYYFFSRRRRLFALDWLRRRQCWIPKCLLALSLKSLGTLLATDSTKLLNKYY